MNSLHLIWPVCAWPTCPQSTSCSAKVSKLFAKRARRLIIYLFVEVIRSDLIVNWKNKKIEEWYIYIYSIWTADAFIQAASWKFDYRPHLASWLDFEHVCRTTYLFGTMCQNVYVMLRNQTWQSSVKYRKVLVFIPSYSNFTNSVNLYNTSKEWKLQKSAGNIYKKIILTLRQSVFLPFLFLVFCIKA